MFQNRRMCLCSCVLCLCVQCFVYGAACIYSSVIIQTALLGARQCHYIMYFLFEGISSSMNFDEEEDDEDEVSSSSSQLNSNTRPGSATSKKSCKVHHLMLCGHLLIPDSWMELLLYTQCALIYSAGLSHQSIWGMTTEQFCVLGYIMINLFLLCIFIIVIWTVVCWCMEAAQTSSDVNSFT